jgi:hypothetical protein
MRFRRASLPGMECTRRDLHHEISTPFMGESVSRDEKAAPIRSLRTVDAVGGAAFFLSGDLRDQGCIERFFLYRLSHGDG